MTLWTIFGALFVAIVAVQLGLCLIAPVADDFCYGEEE